MQGAERAFAWERRSLPEIKVKRDTRVKEGMRTGIQDQGRKPAAGYPGKVSPSLGCFGMRLEFVDRRVSEKAGRRKTQVAEARHVSLGGCGMERRFCKAPDEILLAKLGAKAC